MYRLDLPFLHDHHSHVSLYAALGGLPDISALSPEAAMAWAKTISDAQQREEAVNGLAASWLRRDQEAAKAWIESQGDASDSLKNMLTQPQPRWGGGAPGAAPGGFNRRGRGN